MAEIQPVPAYALPFLGNEEALKQLGLRFNPQWLKWFLDMLQDITTGGAVEHNTLGGLQGGTTAQFYHLTSAEHGLLSNTQLANRILAGPATGAAAVATFRALVAADLPAGTGTVTSVAAGFTGGIISVAGSPITTSGTLAFTLAGTSGGIPYFSDGTHWASSAALGATQVVRGGGAGAAPNASGALTFDGSLLTVGLAGSGAANAILLDGAATGSPYLSFQQNGVQKASIQWLHASSVLQLSSVIKVAGTLAIGTPPTYSITNVTTDRAYDANVTTLDEVADCLGTLIADLRVMGLVL